MPLGRFQQDKIFAVNPLQTSSSDRSQPPIAVCLQHNILDADSPRPLPIAAPCVVLFSGWFPEENHDNSDPNLQIRNCLLYWSRSGRELVADRLRSACHEALEHSAELWLRPHARHAIGDIPGCLWILNELPELKLLLDPASMITRGMLPDALDHWTRIVQALGDHPRTAGLVLSNVESTGSRPIEAGVINPDHLVSVGARCEAFARLAVVLEDEPVASLARFTRA